MTYLAPAAPPPSAPARPLRRFARLAALQLGLLAAAGPLLWPEALGAARAAPAAAFALAAVLAAHGLRRSYPHAELGLCNAVTLARATLVSLLAAPLLAAPQDAAAPAVGWTVLAVAGLCLALDGFDGPLARRAGLVSRFGARFDVETDAALALALAALAWRTGELGPWVLLLGLPRYAFLAAGALAPWLGAPLEERFRRKAVCVLQLSALILLQAPPVPASLSAALAAAAAAALVWSFALDVAWLRRRARRT